MVEESNGKTVVYTVDWDDSIEESADSAVPILRTDEPHIELQPAYYADPWFYRIVGGTLCIVVIASMGGMFYLAGKSIDIPEGIIAVASTAVGALAGVLAGSRL